MYYYPGDFPSKERNVPEQILEPIEDYSEMTEDEIWIKAVWIQRNPTTEQQIKILKHVIDTMPDLLFKALEHEYPRSLMTIVENLVAEGEIW